MRRQEVPDDLRARLRGAAGAHEPDRARVLARIERGMAAGRGADGPAGPRMSGWLRVAGATAAVAGVLTAGGYAVTSAVRAPGPTGRQVTAASPTSPSPGVGARPSSGPAAPVTGRPSHAPRSSAPPSPGTRTSAPPSAAPSEQDGPLWSDGSVDPHSNAFWAQSDLTLRTTSPLTALTVRLRVAQTGRVASTGAWRTLPEQDFTLTVGERDGFLLYTWALRPGRTVPAGEWVFAGQYDHERGGRDAHDDSYTMSATADGERHTVRGDFTSSDIGHD